MTTTLQFSLPLRRRRFLRAVRALPTLPDLIGKPDEYQMSLHDIEGSARDLIEALEQIQPSTDPNIQSELLAARGTLGFVCTLAGILDDQSCGLHPLLEPWLLQTDRTKLALLDSELRRFDRKPRRSLIDYVPEEKRQFVMYFLGPLSWPWRMLRYLWDIRRAAKRGRVLFLRHEFVFEAAERAYRRVYEQASPP